MNTIQMQSVIPTKNTSNTVDAAIHKSNVISVHAGQISGKPDVYNATSANDAVVAKILSHSLSKSMSSNTNSMPINDPKNLISEKFELERPSTEHSLDIHAITDNVVGFVKNALTNLAAKGINADQLSFFKNEAIKGVEVGIDQAKLELAGLVNDKVYKTIDETKTAIIGGIHQLPVEPKEYQAFVKVPNRNQLDEQAALNAIEINTVSNKGVKIDFDVRAFSVTKGEDETSIFTSSSSNTSFSVQGEISAANRQELADLVNKVDGLANSFYRGNIENAYLKSSDYGYNDRELIVLAHQMNKMDNYQQMKIYGDIQHSTNGETDTTAPKAVAEYVNRYLDTLENNQSILASEDDFNQIINGLVNQMKDVQVPDLLQAINRFHAFNSRFR